VLRKREKVFIEFILNNFRTEFQPHIAYKIFNLSFKKHYTESTNIYQFINLFTATRIEKQNIFRFKQNI